METAREIPSYRAPELMREDPHSYSNKVDIWALGCILHEIALCENVFLSDAAVLEYCSSRRSLNVSCGEHFDGNANINISNAIHDMLQIDPSQRPSASVLLERFHRYYQQAFEIQLHTHWHPSSFSFQGDHDTMGVETITSQQEGNVP